MPSRLKIALPALIAAHLSACVPPPAPLPPPRPVASRIPMPPPPAPLPAPAPINWLDAPQTPGDWIYLAGAGLTSARFGVDRAQTVFALSCTLATRSISLIRPVDTPAGAVIMRVRTRAGDRDLRAEPVTTPPAVAATLPARDPLLDAMAYARGRFAVETAGKPTLYVPAWPEVARVVEDCR